MFQIVLQYFGDLFCESELERSFKSTARTDRWTSGQVGCAWIGYQISLPMVLHWGALRACVICWQLDLSRHVNSPRLSGSLPVLYHSHVPDLLNGTVNLPCKHHFGLVEKFALLLSHYPKNSSLTDLPRILLPSWMYVWEASRNWGHHFSYEQPLIWINSKEWKSTADPEGVGHCQWGVTATRFQVSRGWHLCIHSLLS